MGVGPAIAIVPTVAGEAVMGDAVTAFFDSLGDAQPPAGARPLLCALWHGLKGDWNAAHAIAQDDDSADGARVHAWLHRIEGDAGNAGYWYSRARKPVASGETRREAEAIAAALLQR
jgi:hypothetical protein